MPFSSSGRSSLMSTASTPPAPTLAPPSCSWRGSTSTTTRPPGGSTCPGPCWWTWSPAPWTASGPDHSGESSDQTTSCLVSPELETTGPRVTTQRVRWTIDGAEDSQFGRCRLLRSDQHVGKLIVSDSSMQSVSLLLTPVQSSVTSAVSVVTHKDISF